MVTKGLDSKKLKEASGRLFEAQKDDKGRVSFPVVIISQGLGNLSDRNYYTAQAIKQAAADKIYEGKKAYFDHPTPTEDEEIPGRSVRAIAGHYANTKAAQDKDGLWVLRGDLIPIESNTEAMGLLNHASEYKRKFPDMDFIGVSINGDGEGKAMPYDEFIKEYRPSSLELEKIQQVEGQEINAITKLTSAVSADLVTEPGARGRILLESQKLKQKRRSKMKMFEFMKKFLAGAEKQDKSLMEEAVKGMLQNESDEDEAKKKEAAAEEAESKHAESMAKAMLQAKKETQKYEGESESEYEARCMKQAMKQMRKEKEAAEAADKEKHEKEKKEADEKAKKEADEKAKAEDEAKKKEGKKDDAGDDEGHADADKDKALIKKMMKQMDEMKKEIESMKQSKKESEDEAKKHHESAAAAKIELEAKKRAENVDKVLRESGLPRYATDNLRELFLTKVRGEDEMKKIIEAAKEVHSKAIESAFFKETSRGFTEIEPGKETDSNDHLF